MSPQAITHIPDPKTRARLLAALYIAQEQYGWLSPEAIQRVAGRLGLSPGQVFSTASFYTMFKLKPQGDYRIQVCEGLSCYLVGGAEPVIDYIRHKLDIGADNCSPGWPIFPGNRAMPGSLRYGASDQSQRRALRQHHR